MINYSQRRNVDERNGAFVFVFFKYFNFLSSLLFYFPSTYVIEVYGFQKSVTLGMILSSIGLWWTYGSFETVGSVFIGAGLPFITNTHTAVPARWYGPKGRSMATVLLILGIYLPITIEEASFIQMHEILLPFAIMNSVWAVIAFLFIYDKPEFPPTMSEEDKCMLQRRE
jgi:hypothetical protein